MVLTMRQDDKNPELSGVYCAVKGFDTDQIMEELAAWHAGQGYDDTLADMLVPYLIERRLAFRVPSIAWEYGDNGRLTIGEIGSVKDI